MTEAIIRGRPVTKGRPRLGRRRRAYTPARTIEYEHLVAQQWDEQNEGNEPFTGPVGVRFIIGSEGVEASALFGNIPHKRGNHLMDNLMRLRELRDNLEWFEDYACSEKKPWKNYRVQVQSTRQLVDSMIRKLRNQ